MPESRNLDFNHLRKAGMEILTKEFGSTLCDKLPHMVREGGKAAMGCCTGDIVMIPVLCHLYWNKVLILDELMIQGAHYLT